MDNNFKFIDVRDEKNLLKIIKDNKIKFDDIVNYLNDLDDYDKEINYIIWSAKIEIKLNNSILPSDLIVAIDNINYDDDKLVNMIELITIYY